MTFDEIVDDIAERLNLSAPEAIERIGRWVNRRYRRVTTSIGLVTFRRASNPFAVAPGQRVQVIEGEKVLSIKVDGASKPLTAISYAEMLEIVPTPDQPTAWAVRRQNAGTVTVIFDSTMDDGLDMTVEVEEGGTTLAGSMEPQFPESWHDILVFGALADGLAKKGKTLEKREAEAEYERMLGELRLHIAVNGYQDQIQAHHYEKTAASTGAPLSDDILTSNFWSGVVNPVDYGAVGDGVTDDTLSLQAAIDAVSDTLGGMVLLPAVGTFLTGNLVINDKNYFTFRSLGATLQFTGTGSQPHGYIGIQLSGTISHLQIVNLRIRGNASITDCHAGVWVTNGTVLNDILYAENDIKDVVVGLALSNATSSSVTSARVRGNYLENIVGETTGKGYGIQCGTGANANANSVVEGNTIVRAQRHSIYMSNGGGIVINANIIKQHRGGSAPTASGFSAIVVARGENCIVSNNLLDTPKDGAIEVAPGQTGFQPARLITVANNVIRDPSGTYPAMSIGSLGPAGDEPCEDITICGNSFYQSSNNATQMEIFTGVRINIYGNYHVMLDVTSGTPALFFRGLGETPGTALYTDDIEVHDNFVYGVDGIGGFVRAVEFSGEIAAGSSRISFSNNRYSTTSTPFAFDGAQSNMNLRVFNTESDGIEQLYQNGMGSSIVLAGTGGSARNTGVRARFNTDDNDFASFMNFQGIQLGNTAENWFVAGRTGVGGVFKFVVNNTADLGEGTAFVDHDGILCGWITQTGNWGVGPNIPNPESTLFVKDGTPTTGDTRLSVIAGEGQSINLLEVRNNANQLQGGFLIEGTLYSGPIDFADRPTPGLAGMIRTFTDAMTNAWGDVITGGGGLNVLGFFNGANWTVIGK